MNELLIKYNELLIERNQYVNLTGHKTIEESMKHNIEDSLLFNNEIAPYMKDETKCIDIGSGGGCPAIPLKISFPNVQMTMVDSIRKKTDFLNEVTEQLGLTDTTTIHTRIEDFCTQNRESFDIVTARAVAHLSTLAEYGLPLLKIGGHMFAFKGKAANEEIEQSKKAVALLGGEIVKIHEANLDKETTRNLVVIKKVGPTPKKYPRTKNLPRVNPL